jgi:formate dehydrogenase major subunit
LIALFDPNKDLGTPPPVADYSGDYGSLPRVSLVIDGQRIEAAAGTSVLRAAALAGIGIPKLCATDSLEAFGSCRLCVVEIEGRKGYPASCTTRVEEGMVVSTQTGKLASLRRNVMELYVSDHPLDCLTCPSNGDCELQDMAGAVGLREVRYGLDGANHLAEAKDSSNPYFTFDPSRCILCSRCVRACDDIQGTFALTVDGRGFASAISPGPAGNFLASDCVSCGACVQACPTAALMEDSVIAAGQPQHEVLTTCAYCGVGCAFKAEMKGDTLVRMTPWKGGAANRGHSCVKGRFALGYASHRDRITKPLIRDTIAEPWREVSWDEAFRHAADRLKEIQARHGRHSIGGIASSRCTNEETYLVQKMVRTAFGNNNVDNCARVCHSPTGFGLKKTLGESAGTQNFDSVEKVDVALVIGANPTDAHPVFASRLKRRLRQGARLIVVDPRRTDLVKTPHIEADFHLALRPGTNVAFITAMAHVIVTEGLEDSDFIAERCEPEAYGAWRDFVADPKHSPEATAEITGLDPAQLRGAARLYARGGNGAIYYGLGVTEHSQGSTMVMGIANLAMATGNIGREGVGVNPLRGQNNVQGSCDMGAYPHELPGYRSVADAATRHQFEQAWGVTIGDQPGLRIPDMLDAAVAGRLKGLYCQGEDLAQSDPNTRHVQAALRSLDCLIVQDLFLNETAKFAHVFLPGSSFLEKDGTFTNAERRISRVRRVMAPLAGLADWQVTLGLTNALGYPLHYDHPAQIMAEIASLTPTFAGVSYRKLEELGSLQWPCNDLHPLGSPIMHVDTFVRGKGLFVITEFVPSEERVTRKYPLLLTTGRLLSQYNVGAQTRRTDNMVWHAEDRLDIHPQDALERGIADGDLVELQSRSGAVVLHARISPRMQPGVLYTTFHHPLCGVNVITSDHADWATDCPEYKVTAVEIRKVHDLSSWQRAQREFDTAQDQLLPGHNNVRP